MPMINKYNEIFKYSITFVNNIDDIRKELNYFIIKLKLNKLSLSIFFPTIQLT